MALLPSEQYVVTNAGKSIVLEEVGSGEMLVTAFALDADNVAKAQKTIHDLDQLSEEDRSFAHFWFGYFYGQLS